MSKLIKCHIVLSLLLTANAVHAKPVLDESLDSRHQNCISADPGYEAKVLKAFWADVSFMQHCAPANGPIASPFTIWMEVSSSGQITGYTSEPNTAVASCVEKYTKLRTQPIPPIDKCVIRIDMSFTE